MSKELEALDFIKNTIEEIQYYNRNVIINNRIYDLLDTVEKALNDFEELKEPHDEYVTKDGKYFATREAYWDIGPDELRYGYTLNEWTGEYKEIPETTMKIKKYAMKTHFTSSQKIELNQKFIDEELEAIKHSLELMKKVKDKENEE